MRRIELEGIKATIYGFFLENLIDLNYGNIEIVGSINLKFTWEILPF